MSRAERTDVRFGSQEIPMTDVATLSAVAPRPAHIPDSAVYDFDFFCDSAYLAGPAMENPGAGQHLAAGVLDSAHWRPGHRRRHSDTRMGRVNGGATCSRRIETCSLLR